MGSVVYKCECSAMDINWEKLENQPESGIDNCIKDYLERYKTEYLKDCKFSSEMPKFDFYLIFHGAEDLYNGDRYNFKQDLLKYGVEKLPCIHLSLYDVFNNQIESLSTKRYNKIIDSSIWNYYVPLDVNNNGKWEYSDNYEAFTRALVEIAQNTRNGLYNLSVAHEYADLNARLVEQSYLAGSHQAISPFLFHSENEMRSRIEEYKNEQKHKNVNLGLIRGYRWRFLLLDDKSTDNLSTIVGGDNNCGGINKLQIIAHNLCHCLHFEENKIWYRTMEKKSGEETIAVKNSGRVKSLANNAQQDTSDTTEPDNIDDIKVVIDCATNVDDARLCLQKYEYEVVLLDYLLDNKEYGYNLLEQLREWHKERNPNQRVIEEKYKAGPNKRFFFMFISAFSTAMHERMLEKGYERTERRLWYIGDGSCPTNSPYLFSYLLLLLMRHRIRDLKKENEGGYITVIDLLNEIYIGDTSDKLDIRKNARDYFNKVLFMRSKYRQLENDLIKEDERRLMENEEHNGNYVFKMQSSLLIQSAFKVVHHFSGAFFEHLQHLVYLTAYGTIRQWEELWEEYIFVHNELEHYDKIKNVIYRDDNSEDGKAISDAIRKYIIELKENI